MGRGRLNEGSTAETARKRPERPWTAARTMEVLRRCPLAIAQRLERERKRQREREGEGEREAVGERERGRERGHGRDRQTDRQTDRQRSMALSPIQTPLHQGGRSTTIKRMHPPPDRKEAVTSSAGFRAMEPAAGDAKESLPTITPEPFTPIGNG